MVPYVVSPFRFSALACVLGLATLGLVACGDDEGGGPNPSGGAGGDAPGGAAGGGQGGAGGTQPDFPDPICTAGTKYAGGTQAFQEATTAWGLDALSVYGVRLNAVDYNGDGYPDLIARRTGSNDDDFSGTNPRQRWLLRNNAGMGFEDVSQSSGLWQTRDGGDPNVGRPGEVIAFADVDNDGDLDAFTGFTRSPDNPHPATNELMLNNGDGTFALGPEDNPIRDASIGTYDAPGGAAFIDYNRDGNVDLWLTQAAIDGSPRQDRLYQGDGTGHFEDVTEQAGLTTKSWIQIADLNNAVAHTNAWSAAACDLNGDGNPELLSSSYGRAPNHLWHNAGPDAGYTFANQSIASGYAFDERTDWTDNESARCWCSLHPTDEDCAGVPPPQYIVCNQDSDAFRWNHAMDRFPFRLGGNSGTTVCADINNDGHLDLLTTEIVHWDVGSSSDPSELLINTGEASPRFERPGNAATGLIREHQLISWNDGDITASVFDFDNDMWPDIYIGATDYPGNNGLLFQQTSPGAFTGVPIADGIDHNRSHGSAVADFDRDGDLDIIVGHSRARCDAGLPNDCYETPQARFFENTVGDGNFIQLSLRGAPGSNAAAIGARITVTADGVTQTREVGGGHGHYGMQDDLIVHVGLGAACEAEVSVRWPDASLTTETYTMPAGYRFAWAQGEEPSVVE